MSSVRAQRIQDEASSIIQHHLPTPSSLITQAQQLHEVIEALLGEYYSRGGCNRTYQNVVSNAMDQVDFANVTSVSSVAYYQKVRDLLAEIDYRIVEKDSTLEDDQRQLNPDGHF